METKYDEYASANASGASCCHFIALILMALLLLRHALAITSSRGDEDTNVFHSFHSSSCWISLAMLHHGSCIEYYTVKTIETGSYRDN